MPEKAVGGEPANSRFLPLTTPNMALTLVADAFVCVLAPMLLAILSGGEAIWWAAALFAATVAAVGGTLLSHGRTPGLCLTGARVVLPSTGSAPGFRLQGWQVADIRNGTDPVLPTRQVPSLPLAHDPLAFRSPGDAAAKHDGSSDPMEVSAVVPGLRPSLHTLVVDEQTRYTMAPTMVIGRDPASAEGVAGVAVPDLSRQLSPEHFRIEQDASLTMTITDLSSTHGTTVGGQGLVAWQARQLGLNEVITAGGHRFRIEPRTRPEHGGAE